MKNYLSKETILTSEIKTTATVTALIDSDDFNILQEAIISGETIVPFLLDGNESKFIVTHGETIVSGNGYLETVFNLELISE